MWGAKPGSNLRFSFRESLYEGIWWTLSAYSLKSCFHSL
jgi:hypothetical protein